MGLLFGIIYPIWLYYQLPSSPVRLKIMGDNLSQSSINWIENYLKLDQSSGNDSGNIMVFNNKDAFTDTNIQKIPGNFAIFEQLYSQISESKTDLDKLNYLSGVTYSGYFGATYEDLSDQSNIPEKLIQLYQKNTGGAWNYFGEGIILSDNENVFVLRRGVEYAGSLHLHS